MMRKTDEEWRRILTPQQYKVLREKDTEFPFTGEHLHTNGNGMFVCAGCGSELFDSRTKFDSKSGWPSFYDVAKSGNVILENDESFGMMWTEVSCANCGGHLGHVFDDGPAEKTGKRYCINSCALNFKKSGSD